MEAFDLLSGTARSWHRRCCRVSSPLRGMWMPILGDGWPSEWRSSRSPYPHREAVHDAESDALLEVSMNGTELTELLRHRLLLAASVMFIQIFSRLSASAVVYALFVSRGCKRGAAVRFAATANRGSGETITKLLPPISTLRDSSGRSAPRIRSRRKSWRWFMGRI